MRNITIFYNNCKWTITFKNCIKVKHFLIKNNNKVRFLSQFLEHRMALWFLLSKRRWQKPSWIDFKLRPCFYLEPWDHTMNKMMRHVALRPPSSRSTTNLQKQNHRTAWQLIADAWVSPVKSRRTTQLSTAQVTDPENHEIKQQPLFQTSIFWSGLL